MLTRGMLHSETNQARALLWCTLLCDIRLVADSVLIIPCSQPVNFNRSNVMVLRLNLAWLRSPQAASDKVRLLHRCILLHFKRSPPTNPSDDSN